MFPNKVDMSSNRHGLSKDLFLFKDVVGEGGFGKVSAALVSSHIHPSIYLSYIDKENTYIHMHMQTHTYSKVF